MMAEEPLFNLFLQSREKIQLTCNVFEEHFDWLEEVILAAKQTFAHTDQSLLPKTPGKKRRRPKKADVSNTVDGEGSPSKRSSVESTVSQAEGQQEQCSPPRRGRAASRLAQERITKNLQESVKSKQRRPSTPVKEVYTTKKTKTTKRVEDTRKSVQILGSKSQKEATDVAYQGRNIAVLRKERDCSLQDDEEPTPKKLCSPINRKSLNYDPSSEEETSVKNANNELEKVPSKISDKCHEKSAVDESVKVSSIQFGECDKIEKEESSKETLGTHSFKLGKESGKVECREEQSSETGEKTTLDLRNTSKMTQGDGAEGACISENSLKIIEDSNLDNRNDSGGSKEQQLPIPKSRSTRTKQKELVSSSSSEKDLHPAFPHPIPKPRTTRTKQRLESSQVDSGSEEREKTQMLPPPLEFTRAKLILTKILKNKEHEGDELSGSDTNSSTEEKDSSQSSACPLPPPEVPKVRSTRTKKKHAEDSLVTEASCDPIKVSKIRDHVDDDDDSNTGYDAKSVSVEAKDSSLSSAQSLPPPEEVPKVRSTRTKKKHGEDLVTEIPSSEAPKIRSTRTKKKVDEESKVENIKEDIPIQPHDSEIEENSDVAHSRSTRTKKRQMEEQVVSNQPVRSTRTKRRKMEEEENREAATENGSCSSDSNEELKSSKKLDTKAIILIKKYQTLTDVVSSEESEEISIPSNVENSASSAENNLGIKTNHRVTRSKVRQLPAAKQSPRKAPIHFTNSPSSPNFKRECCTPKSDKGTPRNIQQVASRVASPLLHSPRLYMSEKAGRHGRINGGKCDMLREVEEIASSDIEVMRSPARITRHSQGKAVKRESSTRRAARLSVKRAKKLAISIEASKIDSVCNKTPDARARINPQPRTPSPQCPSEKIVRPKMGHVFSGGSSYGSSGRITPKTYSRIRPGLVNSSSSSSSNEYHKTLKKINTPNEVKRTKNIITGMSSFIKVIPAKPTREEFEEKRHMELQKKRERETETRKKKEELLKSKVEEQKRRNEERMKRAKDAREEKERKAIEAKEQQEKERKQREERRLKEEQLRKKQQLLAKKAEEEAKARKIKEQQEEEKRRLEELKLAEEAKAEEARRAEEERKAELRLQEEEKRKRIAEVERIARERKEMEQLKLREAERLAAAKKAKLNATSVQKAAVKNIQPPQAHNSTFTKVSEENKENCNGNPNATFTKGSNSKERSDSYEMTPDKKKKTKTNKKANGNDYDINDIKSDDSTDDETAPKKRVPTWAQGNQLKAALINQEYYPPVIHTIFPPEQLLTMPDLMQIFPIARRRFFKRTSSATWNTPPSKIYE